ncbi:LacI family DNA-binding transcriptional regulator [Microbacterium arabinogalactanolyticum]|uniref:LacI family DNA-binding transcriptional regulator n=1 Tax=Microbacterium arabinogalactanolyticum TaxID=69365 RepID=UPI00255787F5|nr:LacI family DNA-binding transcriptional regulator [Microbacterium arabinogalactanolyticum]GLC86370.1 LacI family transcriptional regulator [Microbacterium arabinogalactanolyticum]
MTIPENTSRSRTARPAPTLHDVAAAAGVSLATASRVLNGSERKVAESFRERVERAAAELGYTANVSAQTIARGTSPVIALLVADIADPYFGLIASGVARGADEQGLIVTIAITEREPQREARILHALRGQRPRGVILAASRAGERDAAAVDELTEFASLGGRTVTFGEGGDRSIRIPNREGSEELGRSMAALGYRRAIGIGASEGVSTSDDRLAGFTAGFTAGGGEVVRVHRGTFERESGTASMTEALAAGVEPGTLIFALSDVVAIGAMTAIRDAGRTVGEDIAVCGFDDVPVSRDVTPQLTTVRVPLSELGYQAFRATVADEWEQPPMEIEVLVRDSTPGIAR